MPGAKIALKSRYGDLLQFSLATDIGSGLLFDSVAVAVAFLRQHFPDAVYLARRLIAWGGVETVLTPENQLAARRMAESWDEHAAECHAGHAA